MNNILSLFSRSGTLSRRDFLRHAALAAAVFSLAFYAQVRYEEAFAHALGIEYGVPAATPLALIFLLPILLEALACLGNPFIVICLVIITCIAAGSLPPEAADELAATHPILCLAGFVLASLLMLATGLRCVALATRRLRDAGSGLTPLVCLFGGLVLLTVVLFSPDEPHPAAALIYIPALLICFITQCVMLLRPTQQKLPPLP